jgi:hypothetical protein
MASWANLGRETGPEPEWILMTSGERRQANLAFAYVINHTFTQDEVQALAWPR